MKKILSSLAILIAATGFSTVSSAGSYYYKGGMSVGSPSAHRYPSIPFKVKLDKGSGLHFSIGQDFNDSFSGEIEFSHQRYDLNKFASTTNPNSYMELKGDISYTSLMFNTIYRPVLSSSNNHFKPYIGAGIGITKISWNKFESVNFPVAPISGSDTVTAGQIFIGNRFELKNSLFVDVEYRYFKSKRYDINYSSSASSQNLKSTAVRSFVLSIGREF